MPHTAALTFLPDGTRAVSFAAPFGAQILAFDVDGTPLIQNYTIPHTFESPAPPHSETGSLTVSFYSEEGAVFDNLSFISEGEVLIQEQFDADNLTDLSAWGDLKGMHQR
jgi:hypothetical protein